jgi:hypothetical protein
MAEAVMVPAEELDNQAQAPNLVEEIVVLEQINAMVRTLCCP